MDLTEAEVKALKDQSTALAASLAASNNEAMRLKAQNEDLEAKLAAEGKANKAASIRAEIAEFKDKLTPAQLTLAESVALALDSDEPTVSLAAGKPLVSPRTCLLAFLQGLKSNGLKDAMDVPALSGKKPLTEEELAAQEENLTDEQFLSKSIKAYMKANPKCSQQEAMVEGRKCLKVRKAELAGKGK